MQISKRNFMKSVSVGFVGLFLGINLFGDTETEEINRIKNIPQITIADYRIGKMVQFYPGLKY